MKANLKSFSSIILISILLFACDNKQPKSTAVNQRKSKDIIFPVKRKPDSTKIAFGDIEFGMSIQNLLNTQTFKSRSSKDLKIGCLNYSYVIKHILESRNIPESLLKQENIIRKNDIQTIEIIDKIGLYKYKIKAILVNNSMNIVQINNGDLDNIVKIISLKYGTPIKHKTEKLILTKKGQERHDLFLKTHDLQLEGINSFDCKEIPKPYCLYEWSSKNKTIKIFSFYLKENRTGDNSLGSTVVSDYLLEIYSDKALSDIVNNFKAALVDIKNNRIKIKAKDSEKF